MNNVNIEGSNVGDKFKTRNGNIVELVYNTFDLEENKHKYLMYLSQSFPMSWFVYEDGRIDSDKDGNWDIVEKVEDVFATTLKKSSFTEQIEEQNEIYKEAMAKGLADCFINNISHYIANPLRSKEKLAAWLKEQLNDKVWVNVTPLLDGEKYKAIKDKDDVALLQVATEKYKASQMFYTVMQFYKYL